MTTNPPEQQPEQGPPVPPPAPEGAAPPPPGYAAPPPAPGYAGPAAPMSDSDQRMWAMFAHLGGILFGFIPALVIWLIHKERGYYIERQSKEALNFQITWNVALIISWATTVILIGFVLAPLVGIAGLIFMIMAGIAVNKGEDYRYPVNVRLIK